MPPRVSNDTLEQVRTRAYGQSVLSFYRLAATEENFSQTPS
jgi:hypothetical protein